MIESSVYKERRESKEKKKFALLGDLLTEYGLPHRQIIGNYVGELSEYSYMVIKPENIALKKFREIIFDLGKKFKQESVIISTSGRVELIYTTGVNEGTACVGGSFNNHKGKNYSEIQTSDGESYFIGEYNLDRQTYLAWTK